MKIFNKGARDFLFHGIRISPDKFTEIPEQHADAAKKLLTDYPNELLSSEDASVDAKAAIGRAGVLEKENATLRAQVEKLQKLLVATDATASETEAIARAEKAEARVTELDAELAAARTPSEAGKVLAAAPDHAPKPAPAKPEGGKKK